MLSVLEFQGETTARSRDLTLHLKTSDEITITAISLYCGSDYIIDSETQPVIGTLKEGSTEYSSVTIRSEGYYTFNVNKECEANTSYTLTFSFDNYVNYYQTQVTDTLGAGGLFFMKRYAAPTCKITIQNDIELYWRIEDLMNEGLPYINSTDTSPVYSNLQAWVDSGELYSLFHQYWLSQWDWYDYYTNYVYKIDPNKWDGYPYIWIPPEIEEIVVDGLAVFVGAADNKYIGCGVYIDNNECAVYAEKEE